MFYPNIHLVYEYKDEQEKEFEYQKYLSISVLERKNKILEEKLKIIFGSKFNINNIYNVGVKPEIIWNKNEIPKLMSEIMILKENNHTETYRQKEKLP